MTIFTGPVSRAARLSPAGGGKRAATGARILGRSAPVRRDLSARPRMPGSIRLPLILVLAAIAGCGQEETPPGQSSRPVLGTVDPSLPPDVQVKQHVLKSILDALSWQGLRVEQLPDRDPYLRFNESPEDFLEPDAIKLGAWQFDGKPQGDDLPVVMYFNLDGSGRNQLEVRRVYTVISAESGFTISRKP